MVEVRKSHRPQSFDGALAQELHQVIQEAKRMASEIKQSADLWDLELHLTQRRKQIDRTGSISMLLTMLLWLCLRM